MGSGHAKIHIKKNWSLDRTEDYPLRRVNDVWLIDFEIFKLCMAFPLFQDRPFGLPFSLVPKDRPITVPLSSVPRDESIIIYISHTWFTEPETLNSSYPDNDNGDKYALCVEGIERILESMVTDKVKKCFLFFDYTSTPCNYKNASDVYMEKMMEITDVLFTPIVDPNHSSWQLPLGVVDYYEDYSAPGWIDSTRGYLSRGWCRTEIFFAADIPLPSSSPGLNRIDLFRKELAFYWKRGKRPHILYGTKEYELGLPPIVLPAIPRARFSDFHPMKGQFSKDQDKHIIEELLDHLQLGKANYVAPIQVMFSLGRRYKQKMEYANGNLYHGYFENDIKEGQGKMEYANGDVYTGNWSGDAMNGKGRMVYASGSEYIGNWIENCRDGEGEFTERDWDGTVKLVFTGNWYQDQQSGQGSCEFANGDTFEGLYKKGRRHGHGVLKDECGQLIYDGEYEDDVPHGYGVMHYPNGDEYNGFFAFGLKHGKGIMRFANDDMYDGEFIEDVMEGEECTLFHAESGESYKGTLVGGKRHGHGELTFRNGRVLSSDFKNNRPVGKGTLKYPGPEGITVGVVNGNTRTCLKFLCCAASVALFVLTADGQFGPV